MKNPENKPLRIRLTGKEYFNDNEALGVVLSNLAIANAHLWNNGCDAGKSHYIACVKMLEDLYGFEFEIMEEK